jgi:hypothetical protein
MVQGKQHTYASAAAVLHGLSQMEENAWERAYPV